MGMGYWNHRIIHHEDAKGNSYYGIHEVHYDDKGNIILWTEEPELIGETTPELIETLVIMLQDVARPQILYEDRLIEQAARYWRHPWRRLREWWDRKTAIPFDKFLEGCKD